VLYSFGPFQLDEGTRRLMKDGEPVAISDRQVEILLLLLSRAGHIIPKDTLIEAAWKDVAVGDNSLEQAVSALRRLLGPPPNDTPYIETLARRGYRFGAAVTRTAPRHSDEALESLLAPHRAFVEGRAALETLERDAIARGRTVFEDIVSASPDYAPGHLGLANALALHVETSRVGDGPDRDLLARAFHHASEACRLDPSAGEAWATLGLVLHQSRKTAEAVAAAQRATALEPDNWRHQVRLAYVSWGEHRLRAAHRALHLIPDLALAHWLAATVHIARQSLGEAETELVKGAAAQDQQHDGSRFSAVGLHLLLGLVRLAQGDESAARAEFEYELAREDAALIYTREACANTWCATGAMRLRSGDTSAAVEAFDLALERIPGHPVALAARAVAMRDSPSRESLEARLTQLRERGAAVEAAMGEAVYETLAGHSDRAVDLVHAAIEQAPAGSAGWVLPVDPFLQVHAHPARWAATLALLRNRAA
jgi:DNA-binding winged helix-turn-helix (wHTH) protein